MSVSTWFESPFVRAFLVLAACATLPLGPSLAAADEPKAPKPVRNWSIEIAPGASIGGPLDDIVSAMESAGVDDGGGGGGVAYPFKSDDTTAWWGAARRRIGDDRWSVGLAAGSTSFGTAYGNRMIEGLTHPDYRLVASVEMTTFAPMGWFQGLPGARLGFGPAMNRVETWFGSQYSGGESDDWKPGLVVEAAVTAPARSRFYFLLLLQYRWIQDGSLGPFHETASNGEEVVFPETDINLSHGFVGVGLGVRF